MQRGVFGRGEQREIDRIAETFPHQLVEAFRSVEDEKLTNVRQVIWAESFYIFRKIFHTLAYDMREFVIDLHRVDVTRFITASTWVTYVQLLIYEMDSAVEHSDDRERTRKHIQAVATHLRRFLHDHKLSGPGTRRCVDEVTDYLLRELGELNDVTIRLSQRDVFGLLDLKSADIELLRRIFIKVCEIEVTDSEMRIMRKIDTIREVFDDIRDYEEDLATTNFNTVIFAQKSGGEAGGDMAGGARMVEERLAEMMASCDELIGKEDGKLREGLREIFGRLTEEQRYYLGELRKLVG